MFDTRDNGLICVMYGLPKPQSDEFRPMFEKRYGKPAEERDLLVQKEIVRHTPDELALHTNRADATVTTASRGTELINRPMSRVATRTFQRLCRSIGCHGTVKG